MNVQSVHTWSMQWQRWASIYMVARETKPWSEMFPPSQGLTYMGTHTCMSTRQQSCSCISPYHYAQLVGNAHYIKNNKMPGGDPGRLFSPETTFPFRGFLDSKIRERQHDGRSGLGGQLRHSYSTSPHLSWKKDVSPPKFV